MSIPGDVAAYFDKQDPPLREVAQALRARMEDLGPELTVGLAWGFPCWKGNERIISIIVHKGHINLQLWAGARLAPQFPQIEGDGKQMRHVKLRALDELDAGIDDIIRAAIALDGVDPEKVR